jgi:hypothetical protein
MASQAIIRGFESHHPLFLFNLKLGDKASLDGMVEPAIL